LADYTFGGPGANDIRTVFTPDSIGGSAFLPTSQLTIDVTGNGVNSTTFTPAIPGMSMATVAGTSTTSIGAFNVGIASSVITGSGAASTGLVQVQYDYRPIPPLVPEPASFAMIGGGLLALAAFARRRRA
jgi:PEP-CTERM motif